jgi:2-polyprenyl-3-methyl-5-hydroxy-6-metoxy-1,4-benzoquinol methylase
MKLSEAAIIHRNVPPDWYQKGIKENVFQRFWHSRRFIEVGKLVEPSGGKILDIGSADGIFTKVILDRSKADLVVGIDVLPASVEYAEKRYFKNKKLKFRVAEAENLPFKKNEFDAVFCLEVLEHVFNPQKVLREIKRVLKKSGYAVFLVPIENLLFRIIWLFWENTRGWIWKGTHTHNFSHDALKRMIEKGGLEVTDQRRFLLGMLEVVKAKKK